ncbi:putative ribonuclease H-like domain-containing protein [Tanacetum coccineum]
MWPLFPLITPTSLMKQVFNTAYSISAASFKDQASTASYADDDKGSYATTAIGEVILPKNVGHQGNQGNRNRDAPRRNAPAEEGLQTLHYWLIHLKVHLVQTLRLSNEGLESLEAKIVVHEKNEAVYEEKNIDIFKVCCLVEKYDVDDNSVNDRFKTDEYVFKSAVRKTTTSMPETKTSISKTSVKKPKTVRPSAPIIEEWDTDNDNDNGIMLEGEPPKILIHHILKEIFVPKQLQKGQDNSASNAAKQALKELATSISTARLDQGIFDSGCSRHMTGNKSFLIDYQEVNGGFVAFAGSPKGGKITRKGKIRTGKLDFEDVYFVKELKFNLFSVSQMCDKKNSVLFTETECLVLSLDFKLLDESQVLLKVPRQNNMYSFDLKNVVPSGGLTCLFAKATIDESNLWHRRLGHINFKTMNKLVRGNLVRGLPSKLFENYHTCVAYQKGNQHKAFCKTKLVSSISQPLQMLHMDLFGPTSVRSINHKTYCLVVTDDYSRFSWVFFLATKDETSGILKTFITGIENQINHKVKIIRCDNGTEFKNNDMNQFCGMKGIKRLVAQGYTQEEGIDYDEVFAPVARIEAIRLFLAYASFMGLIVYQMDVKSAFLYGTIEEEVYVCQPPGFEDPQFPDKVYKVEKALYGLHQAPRAWYETLSTYLLENRYRRGTIDKTLFIKKDRGDILLVQVYVDDIIFGSTKKSLCVEFEQMMHKRFQMSSMGELTFFLGLQVQQKEDGIFISQDKYVADILKKFDFTTVKAASTPIETNKALNKDEEAEDVDVHLYRSMIGSLMYLTASRPDIMFAVCACARFQVTPKTSHLHAVKRIFRYLKGQPKLGLWYPRDSPFDLEAFSDSDYARASLDRKSTTGGCQFLGKRLISWQCKKQTIVANSTTEAEYVVAANLLWARDSYEKKLVQVIKIHTDHNVADLLTKAFDVSRKAKRTTEISQSSRPIHLVADETVYKEWEDRMEKAFHYWLLALEAGGQIGVDTARHKLNTASIKVRFYRVKDQQSQFSPISAPSTSQPPTSPSSMQTTHVAEEAATMPIFTFLWRLTHLEKLLRCVVRLQCYYIQQSILASPLALRSLMGLISASSASVSFPDLLLSSCIVESILILFVSTKSASNALHGLMVVSKDEDALEDLSKQGRKIAHIDEDERITLVQMSAQTRGRHEYDFEESDFEFIALEEDYTAEPYYSEEWDNIQAQIEADEELAHRLQAQERERYSEADKARLLVELINERKNMGSHTLQQLKKLSFDEVKELFETTMKRVNTFTPMESDDTVPKVVAGSSKIDAEQELNQESSKRQKIGEGSEPAEESKDELSQEQLQQLMIIVPEEGMNVEALQTKYPIIDWEVYTEDSRKYWKIIKVGNHTEVYQIFEDMLKNFDRDDLVKLWSLVHERFNSTEPTEDKERELWVELKRLFEPDDDDTLWKLQRYMHDPLKWRLYDTCVVHHVSTERGHDIFMLVEKDYPLTRALMTLMLCNKL